MGGKEGTHYNISGERALRARITITITVREKGIRYLRSGCTREGNKEHTG